MNLLVNGKTASMTDGETLDGYLASRSLDPKSVVVELNDSIVPRDRWPNLALKEGDRLEIVSFVGGG